MFVGQAIYKHASTNLLPHGLCRQQQRFDGDEEGDEGSLALAPERVITAAGTSVPLLTVPQQHCWCVDPERPIDLPSGMNSLQSPRDAAAKPVKT